VLVLVFPAVLTVVASRLFEWHGVAGAALFIARRAIAALLMWAMLAIIIRAAPAARPQAKWVSAAAALAIGGWVGASIVFGLHVRYVADFKSGYGDLISVVVLMACLYWLSLTFLIGVLVDVELAGRAAR
jgi:membrane protein